MSFDNQRLFDLVRQQRIELFAADLITHDEYAELATEHSAVRRLEDYDVIQQQLATERAAHAEELRQFRKMLWLGHGHTLMYGDDGEMQCAECLRFADRQSDYKRNDLLKLLAHVLKMHAEELRRVEQERQWQPIETAPKRGDFIDLWLRSPDNSEQWREAGCWWNAGRKLWANHNGMWDCATHWMPIPAPPSEQAKGGAR